MDALLMEKFQLNPLEEYLETDFSVFDDGFKFYEDVIKEASDGVVTKSNVLTRLWELLKKVFRWIWKALGNLINVIKSLFKKKTKSTEQILLELGVVSRKDIKEGKVHIPASDKSEINIGSEEIELMLKPMFLKFEEDGETITITTNKIIWANLLKRAQGKMPGNDPGPDIRCFLYTLKLIEDKNNVLKNMGYDIARAINADHIERSTLNDVNNFCRLIQDGANDQGYIKSPHNITLRQLMDTQGVINDILKAIEGVSNPYVKFSGDISVINAFSGTMTTIQMGMNLITKAIKEVYTIDPSYCETIDDPETLSKFVEKCIQAKFPAKYLSFNSYLVSTKNLKGDGDAFKPVWGQSRVVFFPPNEEIVYKLALSQWGINSNMSEYNIYQKFDETGDASILARVINVSENGCVSTVERVDTKEDAPMHIVFRVRSHIENIMQKHSIPVNVTQDIHHKNIGIRHNNGKDEYVAVDYAAINRSYVGRRWNI